MSERIVHSWCRPRRVYRSFAWGGRPELGIGTRRRLFAAARERWADIERAPLSAGGCATPLQMAREAAAIGSSAFIGR
ncbi:hypothetical protein M8494_11480 [Serratia ureilytica]